ncbi:MAG TPA: type II toxin-antitoxin system VapC family toxin [Nitrospiraceae bacterium]|nr:type II toxin-antitoxin system VapC family toxin [Nitrospiraceae bacterium]
MPTSWAYFDTSVLVKRYVKETGSSIARKLFQRHRFLSSAVAPVEVLSALARRRAAGELTQRDFLAIRARLHKDRAYWELIEVGSIVLSQAEELVEKTGLRTLDALHVASALSFQAASGLTIPFATAEMRQREAAETLALNLVWVE